jgi:hypothetical protein
VIAVRRRIERAFCELVVYLLRGDLLPENLSQNNSFNSRLPRETTMRRTHILLTIFLAAFTLGAASSAQAQDTPKWEVFGGYSWVRANIVVSGTPFNMNGGSASVAYNLSSWFGLVGDFGIYEQGQVAGKPFNLTVTAYEFGPRVSYRKNAHVVPFAQVLFGGGHTAGTLYSSPLGAGLAPLGNSNGFNFSAGGGLDWKVKHNFSIRLAQAEYLHTQFLNGSNNSQSNFRLSTGVVFSFGKR